MKLFIHLPNFNGRTIEVWEWTKKFVPHLTGHVITYPWAWDYLSMSGLKLIPVSKKGPLKSAAVCITLQWRHSGRDGVSNHQPHHCSLNRLFRRRSKKTNKNSPNKWPVTRKMFPLDAIMICRIFAIRFEYEYGVIEMEIIGAIYIYIYILSETNYCGSRLQFWPMD